MGSVKKNNGYGHGCFSGAGHNQFLCVGHGYSCKSCYLCYGISGYDLGCFTGRGHISGCGSGSMSCELEIDHGFGTGNGYISNAQEGGG